MADSLPLEILICFFALILQKEFKVIGATAKVLQFCYQNEEANTHTGEATCCNNARVSLETYP